MQKKYLNNLRLICRQLKADDTRVIDIIMYGSSTTGKAEPGDVDILILFSGLSVKEQIVVIQTLKKGVKGISTLDVKGMNIQDFFNRT